MKWPFGCEAGGSKSTAMPNPSTRRLGLGQTSHRTTHQGIGICSQGSPYCSRHSRLFASFAVVNSRLRDPAPQVFSVLMGPWLLHRGCISSHIFLIPRLPLAGHLSFSTHTPPLHHAPVLKADSVPDKASNHIYGKK
jgi:hypothetical protein